MSWSMLPGVRSRIGPVAALGALAAAFALSMPAPAFAGPPGPPPPPDPDCLMDPTNPECQAGPNIPVGPDDARCNGMPSAVGCEGGRFDDDDHNNWPGTTGDVMW